MLYTLNTIIFRLNTNTRTYPYKGTSGTGCKFDATKVVTKFSGYENVTSGDEVRRGSQTSRGSVHAEPTPRR